MRLAENRSERSHAHGRRQLAEQIEKHSGTYDVARVLHVLDPANAEYQRSIVRPEMRELGDTVDQIWLSLLRDSSKFIHVDPRAFRDSAVTSEEYVARYPGSSG